MSNPYRAEGTFRGFDTRETVDSGNTCQIRIVQRRHFGNLTCYETIESKMRVVVKICKHANSYLLKIYVLEVSMTNTWNLYNDYFAC